MTLISAYEVRYHSPASTNYDVNNVNRFIKIREEYVANECLSWTLYAAMLASKIVYTGVDWSVAAGYVLDDVVNDPSTGLLYQALQVVPAGTALSDVNYWVLAPKFASASYNGLWEGGLRDYLALSIYRASLAASTFRGESKGVMAMQDAVSKEELSYVSGSLKEMETEAYANMIAYLKRNALTSFNSCLEDENCSDRRQKNGGFLFYGS